MAKTKKNNAKPKKPAPRHEGDADSVSVEAEVLPAAVPQEPESTEVAPEEARDIEVEVLPAESTELPVVDDAEEVELSEETGIVRYDPLSAYLREISRYSPITKEEELSLAKQYLQNKDLEAAYKLVTSNLWLVVKIAREYERAARNLLDLIQEGNVGLMEAVKNFDPYRGVRFPSYASWWVKAYMLRFLLANWRLVKIGTTQAQRKLFFNLKKEKERLEREGFFPGPKLIAEALNVRESDVVEMEQRLSAPDVSVHAPMQSDGEADYLSVLPSAEMSAEEILARKESRALVQRSLEEFAETLNEKELAIFRERMLGEEKATLNDIAERFSLSKERIRQLETRIREKLKVFLSERLGNDMENVEIDKD